MMCVKMNLNNKNTITTQNKWFNRIFMKPDRQRHPMLPIISILLLFQVPTLLLTPLLFIEPPLTDISYKLTPFDRVLMSLLLVYVFGSEIGWWVNMEIDKRQNIQSNKANKTNKTDNGKLSQE